MNGWQSAVGSTKKKKKSLVKKKKRPNLQRYNLVRGWNEPLKGNWWILGLEGTTLFVADGSNFDFQSPVSWNCQMTFLVQSLLNRQSSSTGSLYLLTAEVDTERKHVKVRGEWCSRTEVWDPNAEVQEVQADPEQAVKIPEKGVSYYSKYFSLSQKIP